MISKFQKEPRLQMNPKLSKKIQVVNEPKILLEHQISKETQIMNEPQI